MTTPFVAALLDIQGALTYSNLRRHGLRFGECGSEKMYQLITWEHFSSNKYLCQNVLDVNKRELSEMLTIRFPFKPINLHLPYKRIVPSVSPMLFFDMHLYPPKSVDCKRLICKIISTAYILTSFSVLNDYGYKS
uniref:Uncharacterized protein n=1 Tax=Glossina austeni TaxID=7395 RepID=A0A1A9UUT1_GLOAU